MADRTNGEITIEADQAKIMDVIADLPAYPDWSDGVEAVEVLETTPEGRPDRARFTFASGPIRTRMFSSTRGMEMTQWIGPSNPVALSSSRTARTHSLQTRMVR